MTNRTKTDRVKWNDATTEAASHEVHHLTIPQLFAAQAGLRRMLREQQDHAETFRQRSRVCLERLRLVGREILKREKGDE